MVSISQSLATRRSSWSTGAVAAARRRWSADAATGAIAAAAAAGATVVVLQVWRADLHVPFAYSYDANFNAMVIKGVITNGWWFTNSALGAPFGQQLYDFAVGGENLDLGIVRLLGFVLGSHDPALVMNVFYLLTFPLSAASAYLVFRWTTLSRSVAATCSVLYALTPYHFLRGETHLFLAADFAVPLGAYLVLGVVSGRPLFTRRRGGRRALSFLTGRTLATVCACAVVASAGDGFYYAVFTLILAVIAGCARAVVDRRSSALAAAGAVVGAIILLSAANLAPTIAYASTHGRNYTVARRLPSESETFGLKLTELLLPVTGHRIRAFATLKQQYGSSATPQAPNEVYDASLGTLGSLGFVWLLIVLAASALGLRRKAPSLVTESRPIAFVAATAFLLGSVGGVSALIAYTISPQIRSWNRISIFIAFLSLLALGLLLDQGRRLLSGTRRRQMSFLLALAGIAALGVADQTTAADVPAYKLLASVYNDDSSFIRAIETRLPRGSMVLELPYQTFPEAQSLHRLHDYDLVRPYLHSDTLRWSYGAMKGRPQDWELSLTEKPLAEMVAGAAASGFDGIYIDLAGFPGRRGSALQASLSTLLRTRPFVEPGRRALFFDLRPYARRLRRQHGQLEVASLRQATLTPPRLQPGNGMAADESISGAGPASWWVTARRATFDLYEPTAAQTVTFTVTAINNPEPALPGRPAHVRITWPDGTTTDLSADPRGTSVEKRLLLRHGHNLARITTNAEPIYSPADPRTLYLQLFDPRFDQRAFGPFAHVVSHPANALGT